MKDVVKRSLAYRLQADLAAQAAEQSALEQLRERHTRAAAAWSELAAAEEAREADRERRAGMARARSEAGS